MRALFHRGALVLAVAAAAHAQPSPALQQLNSYLNDIGIAQADARAKKVATIHTREEADQRQAEVRGKILKLIGGLPEHPRPIPVQQFGTLKGDGFRVENIAYQSLPEFYVTANVFVPASGAGPFPAIVITPGHGAGKQSEFNWGANLARAGIVALVLDPIGQGERMQHWDPEIASSKIERLGEHEHASLSNLLIGDHLSRYFINDGIAGVDYLSERKDVDAKRIGAFGCSGGGTITAYLAALDPRIRVAASACYITSLKELFPTQGPQDAEQTLPRFAAEGLDFADWVELAAPRPYAIVSTQQDMFPFAGAQQSYDEAKRFYELYGAGDKLQWITGPGGHGNLGPISNQILGFLAKNLQAAAAVPEYRQFRPTDADDLTATPSGQISISLKSKTVETLNRERAQSLMRAQRPIDSKTALAPVQQRIRLEVRQTAAITAQAAAPPAVNVVKEEPRDGYRVQTIFLRNEPGVDLSVIQGIPDGSGLKPVVVLMDEVPAERTAAGADFVRLVKSGHIVTVLQSRGTPIDAQNGQSAQFALGPYMALNLRAIIVGKTLVGIRTDDVIGILNWLSSRADVDRRSITLYGKGGLGMVALHAAAVDARITRVMAENTLVSYRTALDSPLHRNLSEITIPGVLAHYDVSDLLEAIAPRDVSLLNPSDAIGQPMRAEQVRQRLLAAFDSDRILGYPARIRLLRRGARDPLPIE
ncbi:MAG TPA: acetylxylan esterase [Bryobacteraceae bacterium]|jgi:cephalosporin-C deacetylase-like acetyl esterase